jgi:hypothetical protein
MVLASKRCAAVKFPNDEKIAEDERSTAAAVPRSQPVQGMQPTGAAVC